jgi:hypothetical protein
MATPTDHPTPTVVEAVEPASAEPSAANEATTAQPTFVKLAMRNMVYQGGKSIFHFALTTVGLLGLLVGLAFITR